MQIKFPEYGRCIANLACSMLKHYGLEAPNPTLPEVDLLLQKQYRNVVVLLLDGMGINVLQKHLAEDGFFRRNLRFPYSSTFPPTTVAATTAVTSGLYPNQSAWLGWTGYFPALDRNVVYFLNKDYDTGEEITECHAASAYVPYCNLAEQIQTTGVQTHGICSWMEPYPRNYDAFCGEIARLCASPERKYIYAYWEEPDKTMHPKGTSAPEITRILNVIEHRTEQLASELQDTLLLITADHGMVDVECCLLDQYPDLTDCLLRKPSIESRAVNFFVIPGREAAFERLFTQYFGEDFLLFTKAEVLEKGLFGTGINHPQLDGMLGSHLAVAAGIKAIRTKNKFYRGEHAGLTEDEMTIPLIAIEKA